MRRAIPLLVVLGACGDDGGTSIDARLEGFDEPDLVCPRDPQCATRGDGVLHVGGGKRIFTPAIPETFTDENMNGERDDNEPFVDADADGEFDGIWLFGGNHPATGVAAGAGRPNDLEARAIAFRQGDITVAVVYIDEIGFLLGDIERVRSHPALAGVDIDHIVVGSTHVHSSPDVIGLWGPTPFTSGRIEPYIDTVIDQAAGAVLDAIGDLEPAQLQIAKTLLINDPANPQSLTDRWNKDIRDPIIFDPTLTVARFVREAAPDETIATLVSWGNHPELAYFDDGPALMSADFPHWLRDITEQGLMAGDLSGLTRDLPGLGGVTVFMQGALGGQIGSLRGTMPLDPTGMPIDAVSHAGAQAIGTNAARRALETLIDEGEWVTDLPLSIRSAKFHGKIENTLFIAGFLIEILGPHPLAGYDPEGEVGPGNDPWLVLRSTYVQVGPLAFITAPGELHPELWVGGYDGSWTWGWPIIDTTKPNSADLATAPQPPYLRDLVLQNDGVRYPVLAGCAEDYIGYIIPSYNYVLHPSSPYVDEAEGDHYEEVYSLGPSVEAHAVHPILELVAFRP
jgi:hypothetical protein